MDMDSSVVLDSPGQDIVSEDVNRSMIFEPSDQNERLTMNDYNNRLLSFAQHAWATHLSDSVTCNALRMADVGWFCTGADVAKCFACFKVLEGWEAHDDPQKEHDKHCKECPLTKLKLPTLAVRTLQEELHMQIAIEWHRKKLVRITEQERAGSALATLLKVVKEKLASKKEVRRNLMAGRGDISNNAADAEEDL